MYLVKKYNKQKGKVEHKFGSPHSLDLITQLLSQMERLKVETGEKSSLQSLIGIDLFFPFRP